MSSQHFPRTLLTIVTALVAAFSASAAQYSSLEEPMKGLAENISHASKELHCPHSGCNFLVTNFVSDDGETSKFAMQWPTD
jgi:hypothetical protein